MKAKTLTERLRKAKKHINRALAAAKEADGWGPDQIAEARNEVCDTAEENEELHQQVVFLKGQIEGREKVIEILHNDLDMARADVERLRAQLVDRLPVTPEKA